MWGQSAIDKLVKRVGDFSNILTVEDHILPGGFGSYVMEGLALASTKTRVTPFALCSDVVGKVAKESELLRPLLSGLEQHMLRGGFCSSV